MKPVHASTHCLHSLLAAALALLALLAMLPVGATEIAALLERMSQAGRHVSYDGVFVYQRGSDLNSMRIIHKATAEGELERLISLSGAPREVIRNGTHVVCFNPENGSVIVERAEPRAWLPLAFSGPVTDYMAWYDFTLAGEDRVAGRTVWLMDIRPRDADRYAYRLWVDQESALTLKSMVMDAGGRPLEQTEFTQLQILEQVPDELLQPQFAAPGLSWYANTREEPLPAASDWVIGWMPGGFRVVQTRSQLMAASREPVSHLVLTDGLAMVSVFVERLDTVAEPMRGFSSLGAVNAFGRIADDFQITVVGEVPMPTVRRIAASVDARAARR